MGAFYKQGEDKHFTWRGLGEIFYVGGSGGYADVDVNEEINASKANILVRSAGL